MLREIGEEEGTDKAMLGYLDVYERLWSGVRENPIKFLEIGAFHGGSLRTWSKYFPNAEIFCVERGDFWPENKGRATLIRADQGNKDEMTRVAEEYGPFDIVVDDGSHVWRHQQASFEVLWPHTTNMYIIEDLGTSQRPEFRENNEIDTVNYVKSIVDKVVFDENQDIFSMEFYRNLVVFHRRNMKYPPLSNGAFLITE